MFELQPRRFDSNNINELPNCFVLAAFFCERRHFLYSGAKRDRLSTNRAPMFSVGQSPTCRVHWRIAAARLTVPRGEIFDGITQPNWKKLAERKTGIIEMRPLRTGAPARNAVSNSASFFYHARKPRRDFKPAAQFGAL